MEFDKFSADVYGIQEEKNWDEDELNEMFLAFIFDLGDGNIEDIRSTFLSWLKSQPEMPKMEE